MADKRVICCNIIDGTSALRPGAKAYVRQAEGSGERVRICAKSRGGRWIEEWIAIKRLANFRAATIPAESPAYDNATDYSTNADGLAASLALVAKTAT